MKTIAIFNPYLSTRGGGEKLCLTLAEVLSDYENSKIYMLSYDKVDLDALGKYFKLDLSRVKVIVLEQSSFFTKLIHKLPLMPLSFKNFFYDRKNVQSIKKYDFDIFINHCYHSDLPNVGKYGAYMCMFPQKLKNPKNSKMRKIKKMYWSVLSKLYKHFVYGGKDNSMDTYDKILSISEFTTVYIDKYWNKDSEIIYPICEDMYDEKLQDKKKIILHTGRFFEMIIGNHHKRQDVLLDEFANMTELHKKGWELHFVGSVAQNAGALEYILDLMKKSEDLPVFFHFNADFSRVKQLFNEASIYWHATGFGVDKNKYPEMQEHFGITTVEAMSAGCIPVVYNSGGQVEIVTRNNTGYTWDTLRELNDSTIEIANFSNKVIAAKRSDNIECSELYNKANFAKTVNSIFSELI